MCESVFDGAVAPGSSCRAPFECQRGTCDGTCQLELALGEHCEGDDLCVANAYCDLDTSLCTARIAAGQACGVGQACVDGLRCIDGVCASLPGVGDACLDSEHSYRCELGLACVEGTCIIAGSQQVGEPCGEVSGRRSANVCVDRATCDRDAATPLCRAWVHDGHTCATADTCVDGHPCIGLQYGASGHPAPAVLTRDAGDACTYGLEVDACPRNMRCAESASMCVARPDGSRPVRQ